MLWPDIICPAKSTGQKRWLWDAIAGKYSGDS